MNPEQQQHWKNEVLEEILLAVAASPELSRLLVFKGARILNLHLGSYRQSLDIDANLRVGVKPSGETASDLAARLERALGTALRTRFDQPEIVRFSLESLTVRPKPRQGHPRGWDGFEALMRVRDGRHAGTRSLPTLEMDIAAPETLGPTALSLVRFKGVDVPACSLERIAGEKLRAFLTSLPEYRAKVSTAPRAVRAKDLHDLARIFREHGTDDRRFWSAVAGEFKLACRDRLVDCAGPATFRQNHERTRVVYQEDRSLQSIPWEEADASLTRILSLLETMGVFPVHTGG